MLRGSRLVRPPRMSQVPRKHQGLRKYQGLRLLRGPRMFRGVRMLRTQSPPTSRSSPETPAQSRSLRSQQCSQVSWKNSPAPHTQRSRHIRRRGRVLNVPSDSPYSRLQAAGVVSAVNSSASLRSGIYRTTGDKPRFPSVRASRCRSGCPIGRTGERRGIRMVASLLERMTSRQGYCAREAPVGRDIIVAGCTAAQCHTVFMILCI
jgi:hypothetical protein